MKGEWAARVLKFMASIQRPRSVPLPFDLLIAARLIFHSTAEPMWAITEQHGTARRRDC